MHNPRIRPPRYGDHRAVPPEFRRVQLTSTLAAGSFASAKIVTPTGAGGDWVASDATLTVWDPLDSATGTTGDRFWVLYRDDSHKWEILGSSGGGGDGAPHRFELTATLSPGGSANAKRLDWTGAAYAVTGDTIIVRDFAASPGMWRGAIGYQGWCLEMDDRGDSEIIWMEPQALFIRFTTDGTFSGGTFANVNDYWNGNDPDPFAAGLLVYDDTGNSDGKATGFEGVAAYDWIDDKYRVLNTTIDEKVRSESGQTPGFLSQVLADWQIGPEYTAGEDALVTAENTGTTPNKRTRLFLDSSDVPGYSPSVEQVLMHDASAVLTWGNDQEGEDKFVAIDASNTPNYLSPLLVGHLSPQYLTGDDFDISWENTGTAPNEQLRAYIDSSDIAGHSASTIQFLKHGTDGNLVWGADNDTDVFVAVNASNNGNYLANLLTDLPHGGVVLGVDWTIIGTAPTQTLTGDVDLSLITGYSGSTDQVFRHDTGGVAYWGADTDTDKYVGVDASQTPNYLSLLLTDLAHTGGVLGVDFTVIGSSPNKTITGDVDLTLVSNWEPTGEQFLKHGTDGDLLWGADNDTDTDKFVGLDASNTPNYLTPLLVGFLSPQYLTGDDFDISWELTGTAPNQQLRAYIDSSDIASHSASVIQYLQHGTDGNLFWGAGTVIDIVGVSPWISVTEDGGEWTIEHGGPNSGETTTTLGSAAEGGATDATAFDFTASVNAGAVWVLSRATYAQGTTKPPLYFYFRKVQFDTKGHANVLSGETQVDIGFVDELAGVSSNDTTPGYLKDKIVGDGFWTDIEEINDAANEDLKIKHIGPRSGETATTLGSAAEGTSTADTTSFDLTGSANAGALWVVSRLQYDDVGTPPVPLYAFFRKISVDSLGHAYLLSAETRVEIASLGIDIVGDSPWIVATQDGANWTISHAGPSSGETTTTIGAAAMGAGSADTAAFDYTASANAGAAWNVSRLYQSVAGAAMDIFYRKYTTDSLGHWNAISAETQDGSISFPDVKVAVNSSNTANYLASLLTDLPHGGAVLGVDWTIIGTAPNQTLTGDVDLTLVTGWSPTFDQVFRHDTSGVLYWGPEAVIDILGVAPWIGVTQDGNEWTIAHGGPNSGQTTTTVGAAAEGSFAAATDSVDLTATTNAAAGWFVSRLFYDESATPPTSLYVYFRQFSADSLGHLNAIGAETRIDIGLRDRLVALDAANTEAFLSENFEDWNATAQFASGKDFVIEHEPIGTAPNRNVKSIIDSNAIPGYNASAAQPSIGKDASDNLTWMTFADDVDWIDVTYASATWTFSHVGPKSETGATAVGQSAPTGTDLIADTDSFTASGSNSLELHEVSRIAYDTINKKFVQFTRMKKYDRKGHLYSVSAETGPTDIVDLVAC